MIDSKTLTSATVIGTVLQLAMIVAGHFIPAIAQNVFMLGGLAISAVAGVLYGRPAAGFGGAVLGGAIAGAVCALIGIAASVALGDTPAFVLAMGTASSAVTGALGGLAGRALLGTRGAMA